MASGQSLPELIAARKRDRRYEDLVDLAGGNPALSRWQQFGIGNVRSSPQPEAVKGMARALGVPIPTVWDAIGVSLGLDFRPRDEGQSLPELIAAIRERYGFTYADLVEIAGGTPGLSRWQQFGTGQISAAPNPDAVIGMARALGVPLSSVWEAIGVSLGLNLAREEESPLLARMPAGTSRLDEGQVALVLGVIDELLRLNDQAEGAAAAAADVRGNVRPLRTAARETTGNEPRGPRGGRGKRGDDASSKRP